MLSDAVYVDPRSARVKTLPDKEGEELGEENEGDEQAEDEEEEKRKSPDNSAEVSRKYEVIGTVLDQEVMSSSLSLCFPFYLFLFHFKFCLMALSRQVLLSDVSFDYLARSFVLLYTHEMHLISSITCINIETG